MEIIAVLIVTGIIRWIGNTVIDGIHAAKGTVSPRWEAKLATAERAGRPAPAPIRYGSRGYFADLWDDTWRDLRTRREAKRAAAAQAGKLPALPLEPIVRAVPHAAAALVRPVGSGSSPGPRRRDSVPSTEVPSTEPVSEPESPPADGPIPTCEHCGARLTMPGALHPSGTAVCPTIGQPYGQPPAVPVVAQPAPTNRRPDSHPGTARFDAPRNAYQIDPRGIRSSLFGLCEHRAQPGERADDAGYCPTGAAFASDYCPEHTQAPDAITVGGTSMTDELAGEATNYEQAQAELAKITAVLGRMYDTTTQLGHHVEEAGSEVDSLDGQRSRLQSAVATYADSLQGQNVDVQTVGHVHDALDALAPDRVASLIDHLDAAAQIVKQVAAALDSAQGSAAAAGHSLTSRYADAADTVASTGVKGAFLES